jgi:phosphoribosyl-ATP pyrophosphohydrolase/phosphoribosyl-AMP cyclohydrolase
VDLTPTIIQDAATGDVLTLAWSSEESLQLTRSTGETWLWSRSRNELWHKGATSGNKQSVVRISTDCDGDALLFQVVPSGPACHRGTTSCFDQGGYGGVLTRLEELVASRRAGDPGLTGELLDDENLRIKKLGEETVELVRSLLVGTDDSIAMEAADLLYFVLVAVQARGVLFKDVLRELMRREK